MMLPLGPVGVTPGASVTAAWRARPTGSLSRDSLRVGRCDRGGGEDLGLRRAGHGHGLLHGGQRQLDVEGLRVGHRDRYVSS